MPVYPTGFSGEAVVPCSHCNANEQGPEPGICHRNPLEANSKQSTSCSRCRNAAHGEGGRVGLLSTGLLAAFGYLHQTPCSYCSGKGYTKV
jgi:hypothetical protein